MSIASEYHLERRIAILEQQNATLLGLLAKAYTIMEHLGEQLNEHDLAFDDEHLDIITKDWELIREAIDAAHTNSGDVKEPE